MALCTLLRVDPGTVRGFAWEHAAAHRSVFGAMQNFPQFSLLPYHLDPQQLGNAKYLLNHQQAHTDMLSALPAWPYRFGRPTPTTEIPVGILPNQNLYDTTGNLSWWLFANHMEHFTTEANLPPTDQWIFPFW